MEITKVINNKDVEVLTKGEMVSASESGVVIKPYGSNCSTCSGGAEGQSQGFLANFMKQRWVIGADKGTNSTLRGH